MYFKMVLVIMPRKYKNKGIAAPVNFKQIWEAIKLLKSDNSVSNRDKKSLKSSILTLPDNVSDLRKKADNRVKKAKKLTSSSQKKANHLKNVFANPLHRMKKMEKYVLNVNNYCQKN